MKMVIKQGKSIYRTTQISLETTQKNFPVYQEATNEEAAKMSQSPTTAS